MLMSRRALLGSTSLLAFASLGACAGTTTATIPQWVLDAVNAFAGALSKIATADLPAAVAAKVNYWIQFAQGIAAQMATADFSTAATLFASLLKVAPGILAALAAAGIAIPGPIGTVLGLFAVLAPAIGQFFGLPAQATMMLAHKPAMSFGEALRRLQRMAR